MGERVQVRAVRAEPGSAGAGGGASAAAARQQDARPGFATRTTAALRSSHGWSRLQQALARIGVASVALGAGLVVTLALAARAIGGVRQVIFAIGMMCALGGLGAALMHDSAGVFWMAIGGLMIGLGAPVRGRI